MPKADDSQLLLWRGLDAHFQHGYNNADGVYAKEVIIWRCAE